MLAGMNFMFKYKDRPMIRLVLDTVRSSSSGCEVVDGLCDSGECYYSTSYFLNKSLL